MNKKELHELMESVSRINEELNKYSFQNNETEKFTKIIDQYTDIKELDSEIINELIDKILVHHKEEIDGNTYQQVEIYYKFVGNLNRTAQNAA